MAKDNIRRGVSYDRVSTDSQYKNVDGTVREDASPEMQRKRCIEHVAYLSKKTPHILVDHISDLAYSGKNTDRPGYQKLWNMVGSGKIDFVIATELSRFFRNVLDFLTFAAHCNKYDVDIVVIGLDLNTASAFGKFMLIILVALAQFERDLTSHRVRENALMRLITEGKINGAAEILGLDRDPEKPGHFLVNPGELIKAEKVLRLFLRLSSKKKVIDEARKLGLTGKRGKELTMKTITIILDNARWRYRGLWYANLENKEKDHTGLPDLRRYQVVSLPHGPLLDLKLLDEVDQKIVDTYQMKKRVGKSEYVYLLSKLLQFEDGSEFTGQPAKNLQYRYYYNKKHRLRIHCDEVHKLVLDKIKLQFMNSSSFAGMLEAAVRKRNEHLPILEKRLKEVRAELLALENANRGLKEKLLSTEHSSGAEFLKWLEHEVEELQINRGRKAHELELLNEQRNQIIKQANLDDTKKLAAEYIEKFDKLTGVEQRDMIARIIKRVELKPDNKVVIYYWAEPPTFLTRRKKSSVSEMNGGPGGT